MDTLQFLNHLERFFLIFQFYIQNINWKLQKKCKQFNITLNFNGYKQKYICWIKSALRRPIFWGICLKFRKIILILNWTFKAPCIKSRSYISRQKVLFKEGAQKVYKSKFTGEHPCQCMISNLRQGCLPVNLQHIYWTPYYKIIFWILLLKL